MLADFSIADAPLSGLTDITFPLSVEVDPGPSSYYWAMEFSFVGDPSHVGYAGLQPYGVAIDRSRQRQALFSVFTAGTSNFASCEPGADGGLGVSCRTPFAWSQGHQYLLTVRRHDTDTWEGVVRDAAGGGETTIGSWHVPANWGLLNSHGVAFTEYFESVSGCAALKHSAVVFGAPTSDGGRLRGKYVGTEPVASPSSGHIDCTGSSAVSIDSAGLRNTVAP